MTREVHIQNLRYNFSMIQRDDALLPTDLCRWIQQNLYNFFLAGYLQTVPSLETLEVKGTALRERKGRLYFDIEASWPYANIPHSAPNLQNISQLMHGVIINQRKTKPYAPKLRAQVSVDLMEWPHMTRNLLHFYAYQIFQKLRTLSRTREDMLASAELLMRNFYPTINIESLRVAADLEMIDREGEAFKQWLHRLWTEQTAVQLPDNLINNMDS